MKATFQIYWKFIYVLVKIAWNVEKKSGFFIWIMRINGSKETKLNSISELRNICKVWVSMCFFKVNIARIVFRMDHKHIYSSIKKGMIWILKYRSTAYVKNKIVFAINKLANIGQIFKEYISPLQLHTFIIHFFGI